jgi:aspartyl/asparaginyl-tRNA synthetase
MPPAFTAETIDYLREFSAPIGEGIHQAVIKWGSLTAVIGAELKDKLKNIRLRDDLEEGELDGFLEQINIHGALATFRVYPLVGPEFVTCEIDKSRSDEIKAALGKYVLVQGLIRYRKGVAQPYRIRVNQFEVLDESKQPTLLDVRGIAPDATDGEDTDEFLRRLRDDW